MDPEIEHTIEQKLRLAWQQQRRFCHVRGGARFLLWLIALLVVDFLLDWGVFARANPDAQLGGALLVVNLAVLGWVLWFDWIRHLRPYDPVLLALAVEKRHPQLSSLLISYLQLRDSHRGESGVSSELLAAMRSQAVAESRGFDFREIVDFSQIKVLLGTALVVFLLFAVLSISQREHFGVLLERLAGSKTPYPTRTRIAQVSGDLTVRVGADATITAVASEVIPTGGTLLVRIADREDDWRELPLKATLQEGIFSRELKELDEDLAYFVRLGDARSPEHRITVIKAPTIVGASIATRFPAYLNLPPGTSDQLSLTVPEGTELSWTLRCDPPVRDCEVLVEEQSIEASLDDAGRVVRFSATAANSFPYTFRWTEGQTEEGFQYDDVEYRVQVEPDRLPEVELLAPASNLLATTNKVLTISARASDDHGLAEAWLVYSLNGSEEERLPIHDFGGATGQEFSATWQPAEHLEGLAPGMLVTVAVEVADHHPDRPARLRRSATRQLTIVTPETYLEWYRGELAAQTEELKRSRDAEATSASNVETLKKEEAPPQ